MFQIKALSSIDYLSHLPFAQKEELHYHFSVETFEGGAKLFSFGQECN